MAKINRPKRVFIGPKPYKVHWDEKAWLNRPDTESPRSAWGLTVHQKAEIYISPELNEYNKRETLLHECLHALFACSGSDIRNAVGNGNAEFDFEEYVISRLEGPMMGLLLQNPKLLAYLVIGE